MITIYTDGSTLKNGTKDALGGFGVVVVQDDKVIAAYAERTKGTTNNREEMKAIIYALENYGAENGTFTAPIVYSDSSYCVNSFTNWIKGWKANNWMRAGGKKLENLDLIQLYDKLTSDEGLCVDLRKVPGHAGIVYNELADALATGKMSIEEVMKEYGE